MNKYIQILFDQFKKANGLNDNETIGEHRSELLDWIKALDPIKNKYAELLIYMHSSDGLIGELGKGICDTIVPHINKIYGTTRAIAITPHIETFEGTEFKVYNGELVLPNNDVFIEYKDEIENFAPNCHPVFNTAIGTLITQLPNDYMDLNILAESSRQNNDVAIGFYGNTNDKDIAIKSRQLSKLKEVIENQYCVGCDEELITDNGTYQHIIVSKQKRLELVKTLTRGGR